MRKARTSPHERIVRIFQRIYDRENRLIADAREIPVQEEPAFVARNIARINAKMAKAVRAFKRVEAQARQEARRIQRKRR